MEQKLITNPAIIKLLDKYKVLWSLNHLSALAHWDLQTYMPEEGAKGRGESLAKISSLSQTLFLDKNFTSLIKISEKENLNYYEKGIIRLLNKTLKYYQNLPPEFIEEFVKTTSEATIVWQNAKEKDNFSLFEPFLEKIINLSRKKADYLGYKIHPYDVLLDEYEEGLTVKDCEIYFNSIKGPIISLLNKIKNSANYKKSHPLENEPYNLESMKNLNNKILNFLRNKKDIRIDISSHPFSTHIGPGDQRITTRYSSKDFSRPYSSLIHEFGHALYELQSEGQLDYTPISGGTSLIIHESQSRFWENFIGKSKDFINLFYKDILNLSPNFKNYTTQDIYEYLNIIRPSLIRTESDEITYHLHIIIRFEIEKELMEDKIKVKDLPRVWNEKYRAYLGVEPKNNSEGILQDVHWSYGSVGYFPTYSLGTALSTMFKFKMEKDIGNLPNLIRNKEGIEKIQAWLKQTIHQYGSAYTFSDLTKQVTKEAFNPKYLLDYLENKYNVLYQISRKL